MSDNPTIFGKIIRGEIPCQKVYEDDQILAFHDIAPKAKVHVLVIPKKYIPSLREATPGDQAILGHLMVKINEIAADLGVSAGGYRIIANNGADGGQEVPHLHFHLLAGERLGPLNAKP